MANQRFLGAALSLLISAGCNPAHRDPVVDVSTRSPTVTSRWHADLASPPSLAGAATMNGSASMAAAPNGTSTNFTIDLANASPGGLHPWDARSGQCAPGINGGVLGSSAAYKPLKVDSDGRATGTATVTLETPTNGTYFVVVHASAATPQTIVACGNLAPPTQ